MNIITFQNVTKEYKLRREAYRSISSEFNQFLRTGFGKVLGHSRKEADPFFALKNATFTITKGESVGIIGPNGAGKSTILRLIANVTKPDRGKIDVNSRIAPLLEVGAGFHPELTGRENVYLNGVILGMSKAEIAQKFDEIVSFSELEQFIDSPIKQYSSGMYMRLGFSVAIHSNFDVLIADEILAVGDQRFQQKCLSKFDEFKERGQGLIFVSHSLDLLKKHCQRGILIHGGQILYDGPIESACAKYQNI